MELIGNLNLQEEQGNAQNLYSSQLYGTFFSIYTLIKSEPLVGGIYTLKSMKLKIMNYKGVVDLGITQARLIEADQGGDPTGILLLEVQAMYPMPDEFLEVENAKGFEIAKGTTVKIERFLKPMRDNASSTNEAALSNGVFDTELYYREGRFDGNDAIRTEHIGRVWPEPVSSSNTELQYQMSTRAAGGWLCPFAWLFII